ALRWWEKQVGHWIKSHSGYLKEKKYDLDYNWWFIHKGVRRAVNILQDLPKTSFAFLDHPLMPKTTNELEAQFGHIGKRWLSHRGLKIEKWKYFMKWFVYFYNQNKKVFFVILLAAFGILLFIAIALTVPWER